MGISPLKPFSGKLDIIAAADIETGSNGELLDINLAYADEYRSCASWREWFDCVIEMHKHYKVGHIWFHNGGRFDAVDLLKQILQGAFSDIIDEDFQCKIVGGSIIELDFRFIHYPKKRIKIADSFRLMPTSLAWLCGAKGFNLDSAKDDVPQKYKSRMEEYKKDYPEKYHAYHKKDTVLLLRILNLYRDNLNEIAPIGNLRLTCGSTALAVYRTGFMDYEINTPGERERAFTRLAYQGGRCEYVGDGALASGTVATYENVNTYDINSEYPAMMEMGLFPTARGTFAECDHDARDASGEIMPGCFRAKFRQVHGRMALIKPLDDKAKPGKHAAWEGEGYGTHLELREIEECGGFVEIVHGYVYRKMKPLFKRFVNTLYAWRLENAASGNTAMVYIIKLIMNNLYGKFGQGELGETFVCLTQSEVAAIMAEHEDDRADKRLYVGQVKPLPDIADNAYSVVQRVECRHAFPAIAAFVTAAGRLCLLEVPNHYNIPIIYCDTDSVHTQETLPDELLSKSMLGKFKSETENATMVYGGRKIYLDVTNGKTKCKGVPTERISMRELVAAIEKGKPLRVNYQAPSSIKSALKNKEESANKFLDKFRTISRDTSSFDLGLIHSPRPWRDTPFRRIGT